MTWVGGFSWKSFSEVTHSLRDKSFSKDGLVEQISLTRDRTDYLWYTTYVNIDSNEQFLKNGRDPLLTVMSAGHSMHVFVNGERAGTVYGSFGSPKVRFTGNVKLWAGSNKISILSVTVGLPNIGPHFDTRNAGVLGPVTLEGLNEGKRNLSSQKWIYQIGLRGESLSIYTLSGSSSVKWWGASTRQPLTWYKAFFNAPAGNEPLALDMSSMGKGQIWINGQSIGRYWPAYKAYGSCDWCDYRGTYNEKKCQSNCGEPSQKWYHVPRAWLNPTGNLLVAFEEWGGDPTGISMVKRLMISVDRSQQQSTYSSSSILCGCCNEHNGRSAVENGDRKARRRRNFDVEDEDGSFGRIWAGEVSDLSCIRHCLPLLFLEAPITGAREGNESRPRAKRKMVVWLLTSLDCSSSPCVTPATREVLRHPINRGEKRSREATRMLAVGHGRRRKNSAHESPSFTYYTARTLKETTLKLRPTGHHEPRAYDAWVRPRTVDAAATGGGVRGGVVSVAFLSGRCLRFLRPQGYHRQWAEENSNLRFHSLSQEHPGGKVSNSVGNVAF
ncbi:unnamed protein product [Musa acuminata subsp. burmannicoides]